MSSELPRFRGGTGHRIPTYSASHARPGDALMLHHSNDVWLCIENSGFDARPMTVTFLVAGSIRRWEMSP